MATVHRSAASPAKGFERGDSAPSVGRASDKKSTAARKDVLEVTRSGQIGMVIGGDSDPAAPDLTDVGALGPKGSKPEAGTQVPPVDIEERISPEAAREFFAAAKRGRPRIHPDRKAYKAEKERERRQRAKDKAK